MARRNDTGLERPYRPMPADFRETYLRMGWDGIEDHYRTNWRVIRRWVNEAGRDQLRADRAAAVASTRPGRSRAKRYVLGLTLAERPRSPAPVPNIMGHRYEARGHLRDFAYRDHVTLPPVATSKAGLLRALGASVRMRRIRDLRDGGMSAAEIAAEVGLKVGTVQRALRRADALAPPEEPAPLLPPADESDPYL